ncbi:MAG: hypothetical protein JWP31_219 [Aeromicrobium sp.]|nr:hypothetical protein [Aeromicrobium sp.]
MSLQALPVVLLAGGVVMIAWALRRRQALSRLPRDWLRVAGRIVEVGGSTRVEYAAADGRRLRLNLPPGRSGQDDGEVAVLVDPRDASRARLVADDVAAARLVRMLLGLGLTFLVLGVLAVVAFA